MEPCGITEVARISFTFTLLTVLLVSTVILTPVYFCILKDSICVQSL